MFNIQQQMIWRKFYLNVGFGLFCLLFDALAYTDRQIVCATLVYILIGWSFYSTTKVCDVRCVNVFVWVYADLLICVCCLFVFCQTRQLKWLAAVTLTGPCQLYYVVLTEYRTGSTIIFKQTNIFILLRMIHSHAQNTNTCTQKTDKSQRCVIGSNLCLRPC